MSVVGRITDRGYQIIHASLPALITVVKGINQPRDPQRSHFNASITKLDASFLDCRRERLGADGSPTQVVKIEAAAQRQRQQVLIDSKLPAQERLRQVITGGIKSKENALKIHGASAEAAKRTVDFILDIMEMGAGPTQEVSGPGSC